MKRLDLRISDEIKEMLRKLAEQENRSMTRQVEYLIKQEFKRKEPQKK